MKKFKWTFKHIMLICIIVILTFSTVIVFYLGAVPGIRAGIDTGNKDDFLSGWANQYGRTYEIKELHNYSKELYMTEPFRLYKNIDDLSGGHTFYMHTKNLVVNIYVDDELVYKTAENGETGSLTAFDNYISFIMDESAQGKTMMLEIYKTKFSLGCCIDSMYIGSGQEIMNAMVSRSFFPLFSALIFAIFGVCFIFLGAFIHKSIDHYKGYIFFGIFLIIMAILSWLDNTLTFATIKNIFALENAYKVFMIAALPPMMIFIDENFELQHFLPIRVLIVAASAFTPITFVLHILGILPYTSLSVAIHAVLAVMAVVLLYELISFMNKVGSAKLGKERIDYISIIIFIFMVLFDIAHYYQGNGGERLLATRIGLYILMAAVTFSCFSEVVVLIRFGIKAQKIEKIAFTDANTGIGNLAAFKAKFDDLERSKSNYKYIGIIQFDVNNLKIINDSKGHEAGDLLIKTAASIIDQAFGPIGWCYRTGGDEFVAITTYSHAPVACEDAINKFENLIDRFNLRPNKPFDLRIAYGVAYYQSEDKSLQNKSLKEIHKIADERMYSKKKELKARYARTPEEAIIR